MTPLPWRKRRAELGPSPTPPAGPGPVAPVQVRGTSALGVAGDMTGNAMGHGSRVTNIHQLIQQFGPQYPDEAPVSLEEIDEAVRTYTARLRQAYGRLDLEVLLPTTEAEHPHVGLREVFVPPLLRAELPRVDLSAALSRRMAEHGEHPDGEPPSPQGGQKGSAARRRTAEQERPPAELLSVIADPSAKRLVLLGNPGAGKSTLSRYLTLALTGSTPPEPLSQLADRLPLIIELRRYAEVEWRERTFEDFLSHLSTMEQLSVPRRVLEACLRSGRAVVIFDGLDELFDPAIRAEVSRRIAAFAARYEQARIIVTSRVIGYQRPILEGVGFRHYMLQDLTEQQIRTFAQLWYDTVCPHDALLAERLRRRIVAAVTHSRPVRELAGNPLLLTILAIIGRRQELPRDRQGVYEHAVNVLIAHWDLDAKHLPPLPDAAGVADLDVRHRRELLRLLARQMQDAEDERSGNLIHGTDLEATFRKYLVEMWEFPSLKADASARAMLRQFQERNFILSHFGGETYGFVHRTFLEYLAAADLAQRYSDREFSEDELIEDVFARRAPDSTWHEVLLLLIGQVNERVAARAIDKLLQLHEANSSGTEILELAVRCLAEVRNIGRLAAQSESVVNAVIDALSYSGSRVLESALPALAGFGRHWSGRRLYLHWFHMFGAISPNNAGTAARIACSMYQDQAIPAALAVHGNWPAVRSAALRSLAERWPDRVGLDCLLRDRAESDADPDVRATALDVLGKRPGDSSEIRDFLLARAAADSDERIRGTALRVLADRCSDDLEVYERLCAFIVTVGNWATQKELIGAAVRHWRTEPALPQLLLNRAAIDSSWAWRDTALEALATHWADNPAVPGLLADRATAEPDEFVRNTAVGFLAELRTGDPAVRDLLVERATADLHEDPREAALNSLAEHWHDDPVVRDLLFARATSDVHHTPRAAALQGLANQWAGDPAVRDLLLARAVADPHELPRADALEFLSDRWTEDPAVRDLVLDRAVSDPAGMARDRALKLSVNHWPDHPGVRELLLTRAAVDLHEAPRTFAVESLAEHWPDDPQVRDLLVDRATADLHEDPREAALDSLAEYWHDDPAVRDLLLARATSDLHHTPRAAALRGLAQYRPDDPAVRAVFLTLATTDPSAEYRQSDVHWLAWKETGGAVAELLHDRATNDSSSLVRTSALSILAFGWPTDPDALAVLHTRAAQDEREVQAAAVNALAVADVLAACQAELG